MDYRVYRKVLRMVAELHVRGFQRLRIAPGMSASGCYWRCSVTPVTNISIWHGARLVSYDTLAAHYSTGSEREYFGWKDAGHPGSEKKERSHEPAALPTALQGNRATLCSRTVRELSTHSLRPERVPARMATALNELDHEQVGNTGVIRKESEGQGSRLRVLPR